MKRISFLIAFVSLMLLAFGSAQGATEIVLDNGVPATGYLGGDTVYADSAVRWNLRLIFTPGDGSAITGFSNGFEVYTTMGLADPGTLYRNAITCDTFPWQWPVIFSAVFNINEFSMDGLGADTISFGGATIMGSGIVDGTDSLCWWIETTPTTDGDTLCIDSAFFLPAGQFVWNSGSGDFTPDWGGPYCFHVYSVSQPPPDSLLIDSLSLTFEVVEGTDKDSSAIHIASTGGAKDELNFEIAANEDWLTFRDSALTDPPVATLDGETPMSVYVIADYTDLDTGQHAATITVTSGADSVDISVEMSIGTGVAAVETDLPTSYALSQNYPNPFNPNTEIKFDIPFRSHVTLTVYNVLGQRVTTLVDKEMPRGSYVADWNSTSDNGIEVTSGVYFYKLEADDFIQTKKMLLLK